MKLIRCGNSYVNEMPPWEKKDKVWWWRVFSLGGLAAELMYDPLLTAC